MQRSSPASPRFLLASFPAYPPTFAMVEIWEPRPWEKSICNKQYLESLIAAGVLPANTDAANPEWIAPGNHVEPNPPDGYVVSFARFHERGFGIPAGDFIRALCHHYEVELHNCAPNSISQAATFVGVCEGFLGIPAHWELWVHLFRGELFTETVERGVRRPVRAGGLVLQVRGDRKHLYIPSTMMSNNQEWDKGWFYVRNGTALEMPP